jgi:hypothetical protein
VDRYAIRSMYSDGFDVVTNIDRLPLLLLLLRVRLSDLRTFVKNIRNPTTLITSDCEIIPASLISGNFLRLHSQPTSRPLESTSHGRDQIPSLDFYKGIIGPLESNFPTDNTDTTKHRLDSRNTRNRKSNIENVRHHILGTCE